MDIISSCEDEIEKRLEELNAFIRNLQEGGDIDLVQTQSNIAAVINERDKNIDKIIQQQAQIKTLSERDARVIALKDTLEDDRKTIDMLRRQCAKISNESMNDQNELLQAQAREVEKYQMQQLRSIADDYRRHQEILEQRKRELETLKKEVENEENNREAYLLDVERNLEKQLMSRQRKIHPSTSGSGPSTCTLTGPLDEVHNSNYLELTTIDEFSPYGAASTSNLRPAPTRGRGGRGRGGAGGSRKRGGANGARA